MIIFQISEVAVNALLWLLVAHLTVWLYDRIRSRVSG